jgi:hypothetical protein
MLICALAGGGPPPPPTFVTLMTRVPLKPPALAVIVVFPTATPVTTPVDEPTVAIAKFDDAHAMVALTVVPAELRAAADSATDAPTATDVALPLIETLAMVWLVVLPVLPLGDVGELLPPPPPQAVSARAIAQVNALARWARRVGCERLIVIIRTTRLQAETSPVLW